MTDLVQQALDNEHNANYSQAQALLLQALGASPAHKLPWVWFNLARLAGKTGNAADMMRYSELLCYHESARHPGFNGAKIGLFRRRIEHLAAIGADISVIEREIGPLLDCQPGAFDLMFIRNLGLQHLIPEIPEFGPDEVIDIPHNPSRRLDRPIALNGPHFVIDRVHDTAATAPQFEICNNVDYISFGTETGLLRDGAMYTHMDVSHRLLRGFEKYREIVSQPVHLSGTAVVLSDVFRVDNYAHWTLDWLPRLLLAKKYLSEVNWVCADIHRTAYQQDCQNVYWPGQGLRWLIDEGFRWYHFDKVVCVTNHLVGRSHPAFVGDPDILDLIRGPALDAHEVRRQSRADGARRRVYISRADGRARRGIINEEELLKLIAEFGFESVILSKLSFREQAALFNNADVVLGSHGAGLTNVIFMRPGTTVIELLYYKYGTYAFAKSAIASGLKYYYMSCSSDDQPYENTGEHVSNANDFGQTSVWVDLALLRRSLEEIAPVQQRLSAAS